MANLAVLLFRQCATLSSAFAAALPRPENGNVAASDRTDRCDSVSAMSIPRAIVIALAIVDVTSCATTSRHRFAEPTPDWQVRSGRLLYRTPKMTLVGDVSGRCSKAADFELPFAYGTA